ncbi:hypothetical protein RRG08_035316 [Elysia crispata]|uniref:Uncharacterized protein n=1 Tax=Elysia crispata TaxID=231223 RepID=A0AAE1D3Q8_9GAST|nr:hypothetical protein RRG08_035316 [Elysia crispata]
MDSCLANLKTTTVTLKLITSPVTQCHSSNCLVNLQDEDLFLLSIFYSKTRAMQAIIFEINNDNSLSLRQENKTQV